MGAHDFRAMHLAASHQDTNLISLGADAAATVYMLPIVCAPALEPLMRFLANTFPDAAMRTVRCCSVGFCALFLWHRVCASWPTPSPTPPCARCPAAWMNAFALWIEG